MVVGQKSNRTNLKPENILPQINLRFKSAQKLGSLIDAVEAVSFQMSLLNHDTIKDWTVIVENLSVCKRNLFPDIHFQRNFPKITMT